MKKTFTQRFFLSLCMLTLFSLLGGNKAWAEKVSKLTFTEACSGSGTADDNVVWTVTSDAAESTYDGTKGIHYGTGSVAVSYLQLKTSGITGTVKKVVVNASGAKGTSAKIDVTVNGNSFGSQQSITKTATNYTFEGSESGEIIVKLSQTSAKKALYVKSISVTYATSTTPSLSVSPSSLSYTKTEIGNTPTQTFTLSGSSLTADAVLAISGTGASMFSVSPSSITPTGGKISDTEVTVTYAPTAAGSHEATLTVSSEGAESKTIALSGTAIEPLTHYTVNWMVNGNSYTEGTPSTDVAEGDKVSILPTTPATIGDKVFMGWTDTPIDGTQDDAPAVLFTTAAEAPAVTAHTTYYAVFADASVGTETSEELTSENIISLGKLAYETEKTFEGSSLNYSIKGYKDDAARPWIQLKKDRGSYIKISAPGSITKVDVTITRTDNSAGGIEDISKHPAFSGIVGLVTTDCSFSKTSSNIGLADAIVDNLGSITTTSETKDVYLKVSAGARVWGITTYYNSATYSKYATNFATLYNLVVSDAGYATYFNSTKAYTMPAGATGYVWSDGIQYVYNSGDVVPANEPLVIKAAAGNYPLLFTTSGEETYKNKGMNALEGTDDEKALTNDEDYYFYGLSLNASGDPTSVGFYWMNDTGAAFTNGAHKAYLKIAKSEFGGAMPVQGFAFNGDTTGITPVATVDAQKTIYDLAGRKVSKATKGIYIINGKKTLVK